MVGQQKRLAAPQPIVDLYVDPPPRKLAKISVSIDEGFLEAIDLYISRWPKGSKSRTSVIEEALELWVSAMQRQDDCSCYANSDSDPAWQAIRGEAAKKIWKR
jgi:hypothetical protein